MIKFILFALLIWQLPNVNAEITLSELNDIDAKMYRPEADGVRDLYVELELTGLKELINQQKNYGVIQELYFKVYWLHPGKLEIEVEGLPKGFIELRSSLIEQVRPYLIYLFPESIKNQLRSFQVKRGNKKSLQIVAKDISYQSPITEMVLDFDNRFLMEKIVYKKPLGTETLNLSYQVHQKVSNKFVIQEITSSSYLGLNTLKSNTVVKYNNVGIWFLPVQVKTSTTHEISETVTEGNKPAPKRVESILNFKNYKVNEGVAHSKIIITNNINGLNP
jgi:hypothetical protein